MATWGENSEGEKRPGSRGKQQVDTFLKPIVFPLKITWRAEQRKQLDFDGWNTNKTPRFTSKTKPAEHDLFPYLSLVHKVLVKPHQLQSENGQCPL